MQNAPGTIKIEDILKRRAKQNTTSHLAPPQVRKSKKIYTLSHFVHGIDGEPPFPKVLESRRWTVYKQNNKCVYCGLHGTHAVVWMDYNWTTEQEHWHFDMVHVTEEGHRVLMTLDHFIPKAKGGPDKIENLVVACSPCNNIKQDKFLVDFDPRLPPQTQQGTS